jgi:two-component system chemotaxis response regulator CheY
MAKNILIVDDSKIVRMMLARVIRLCDMEISEILEAENGNQALEILASKKVALVLTDLNMPELNGMDLIRQIRRNKQWEKLPIAVISAHKNMENDSLLEMLNIVSYISKPFMLEDIKSLLLRVIKVGDNCGE